MVVAQKNNEGIFNGEEGGREDYSQLIALTGGGGGGGGGGSGAILGLFAF